MSSNGGGLHLVPANSDRPETDPQPDSGPMVAVGVRLTISERPAGGGEPRTETISVFTPWLPVPDLGGLLQAGMPRSGGIPADLFDPFGFQRAMMAGTAAFWGSMANAWVTAATAATQAMLAGQMPRDR